MNIQTQKAQWKPGNRVESFVTHERIDADECYPIALDMVFPEVVARVFPNIRNARMGTISTDRIGTADENGVWHDLEKFGSPNTIFVGVGKGLVPGSFDEHSEIDSKQCAATKIVAALRWTKEMRRAIRNSLASVLYEEKFGTEVTYEIPGMVKKLHDSELFTELDVREWCALAYAAQIKNDLELVKKGDWKPAEEKGWQLCVGKAYGYIRTFFGEQTADDWKEMARQAMEYGVTLKFAAREEIARVQMGENLSEGEGIVLIDGTRAGSIKMLSTVTENRVVGSEAINMKGGFGIVVVRNSAGNTQVMMDRRKKWCSCNVCRRLRESECEVRGLPMPSPAELLSHDSIRGCPFWNRFQEAPYVVNGTLKHTNVEPTKLTLRQVGNVVIMGVRERFKCPDWQLHHWLWRKDSVMIERERKEKVEEVDQSLRLLFSAAEAKMAREAKRNGNQ